jgi:hypothetical protein
MANVFFTAVLLSGILAVSGCAGLVPGLEALGTGGGGGYPSNGGGQAYPYDPGQGGGYAQPVQPSYQPQLYAYSGNPGGVYYQQVPPAPQGYNAAAPSGRWLDRRQQRQQDRIQQGVASGQLTPREARRLHNDQGRIWGAEGRMRADGNLSPQERARLNTMQNRSSQDINRLRHNGVQAGPTVQPRPTRPGQPGAELRPAAQPQASVQSRAAAQPRANGGRPARHDGGAP